MMYSIHKDYLPHDIEDYMVLEITRCHDMYETWATGMQRTYMR